MKFTMKYLCIAALASIVCPVPVKSEIVPGNGTISTASPSVEVTVGLNINGEAILTPENIYQGMAEGFQYTSVYMDTHYFNASAIGKNEIPFTATDDNGNKKNGVAIINVVDTFPPVVFTKDITVYLGNQESVSVTSFDLDNGSFDNGLGLSLSLDQYEFNCSHIGKNKVRVTATDASGNTRSSFAWVTVVDAVSPSVRTRDITVLLDEYGMATVFPGDVDNGSYDQCGIISMELNKSAFGPTDLGENTVRLMVTDIHGNMAVGSATVIVLPNTVKSIGRPVGGSRSRL